MRGNLSVGGYVVGFTAPRAPLWWRPEREPMDGPEHSSQAGEDPQARQAELDRLAEDWITLWQSEITAMAADREAAEAWATTAQAVAAMAAAWTRAASAPSAFGWPPPFAADHAPTPGHTPGHAPGHARQTPRPAPAATPPDARRQPGDGGSEIESRLAARLAELERRLAEIEGGPGGKPANRGRARRRKPPA